VPRGAVQPVPAYGPDQSSHGRSGTATAVQQSHSSCQSRTNSGTAGARDYLGDYRRDSSENFLKRVSIAAPIATLRIFLSRASWFLLNALAREEALKQRPGHIAPNQSACQDQEPGLRSEDIWSSLCL
jgi:hypothetical protein